jgi:predicted small secreted protein
MHRILTLTSALVMSMTLTGCATFSLFGEAVKPLAITTVPAEKTPLALPDPEPISTKPIKWRVITPDNVDAVWEQLEQDNEDAVVFAITADGYQQLAVTIAELRKLIVTQRVIIQKYREYYEPAKPAAKATK